MTRRPLPLLLLPLLFLGALGLPFAPRLRCAGAVLVGSCYALPTPPLTPLSVISAVAAAIVTAALAAALAIVIGASLIAGRFLGPAAIRARFVSCSTPPSAFTQLGGRLKTVGPQSICGRTTPTCAKSPVRCSSRRPPRG